MQKTRNGLLLLLFFVAGGLAAQQNEIVIDTGKSLGQASLYIYGQFIEYMGQDIEGGIYDPESPLADSHGIRQDVLEKAKELAPSMIRFPGGTFVKTFHWMDGVGPKEQRRPSKNLIWGGINS
ncbi:MAG: alpha-N-arabinofuranosidase, partial [Bacteroidaceae bacterium]|nr:alpha-N-arabinofuranosidase [Bacteroidaceae bacterium]